MATLVKQFSFADDTPAVAAQVNADFDDAYGFVNNAVAHVDGSKAYTGLPLLPASNPTLDNQMSRKRYVDDVAKGPARTDAAEPSGTIPSGSPYTLIAGASATHVKKNASSKVVVVVKGQMGAFTAAGLAEFAIRVDGGADTKIGQFFYNDASGAHFAWKFITEVTGGTAASHTYALSAKTTAVGLSLTGAYITISVSESW